MKRTLSAAIGRIKGLVRTLGSGTDGTDPTARDGERDDGPDLFECEGCGKVFISRPEECSTCEDDDFSNVGKFE